ncbi:MAG: hypothetical protein BECKG1743E_GA0114224_103031 [Candidatus Kentron sp. G]|nr:MAG: hypothetical protein BECKG1743E_GA0114224_103031 [Candidatus Kentron sp. G]
MNLRGEFERGAIFTSMEAGVQCEPCPIDFIGKAPAGFTDRPDAALPRWISDRLLLDSRLIFYDHGCFAGYLPRRGYVFQPRVAAPAATLGWQDARNNPEGVA